MKIGNLRRRPASWGARRHGEQGYILLTLVVLTVFIIIGLMADARHVANEIRHDREQELVHRGAQYARAIKKYFKKTGTYPARLEQLEDTNHIRFLRRRYKDPMTGQDFRLLHYGEVQLAPGGGVAGATSVAAMAAAAGANAAGAVAGGAALNPGMLAAAGGAMQAAGALGAQSGSPFGSPGNSSSPFSSINNPSSSGSSSSASSGPGASPGQPSSSPGTTFGGGPGATFGGGPIIGVASTSKKQSMMEFNKKDHYNDWWFVYDPTADRGALIKGPYNGAQTFSTGGVPGAVPAGAAGASSPQPSNSPFGQPSSPSSQPGGSSFGSSGGSGFGTQPIGPGPH